MRIKVLILCLFLTACSKGEKIDSYYSEKIVDAFVTNQIKTRKDFTGFLKSFEEKLDVSYREFMISCVQEIEADPVDMPDILMLFRDVMSLSEEALLAKFPSGIPVTETAVASHSEIQNECFANQDLYIFD